MKLQILLVGSIYTDADKDEQQSGGSFRNAYVTSLKIYFVQIRTYNVSQSIYESCICRSFLDCC